MLLCVTAKSITEQKSEQLQAGKARKLPKMPKKTQKWKGDSLTVWSGRTKNIQRPCPWLQTWISWQIQLKTDFLYCVVCYCHCKPCTCHQCLKDNKNQCICHKCACIKWIVGMTSCQCTKHSREHIQVLLIQVSCNNHWLLLLGPHWLFRCSFHSNYEGQKHA